MKIDAVHFHKRYFFSSLFTRHMPLSPVKTYFISNLKVRDSGLYKIKPWRNAPC